MGLSYFPYCLHIEGFGYYNNCLDKIRKGRLLSRIDTPWMVEKHSECRSRVSLLRLKDNIDSRAQMHYIARQVIVMRFLKNPEISDYTDYGRLHGLEKD